MVKFLPGELSAADVIHIAAYDRTIRTAVNPFGRGAYRTRYGGKAVPWKLVRKADDESTDTYLTRLSAINSGVSGGLKSAIAMSKRFTQKGVSAVIYNDGTTGIMPTKSAMMGMAGKDKTIVEHTPFASARAALAVVQPTMMIPA